MHFKLLNNNIYKFLEGWNHDLFIFYDVYIFILMYIGYN